MIEVTVASWHETYCVIAASDVVPAIYPSYLELRYSHHRVDSCCPLCLLCKCFEMLVIFIHYAKIEYCVLSLLHTTNRNKKSSLNKKVRIHHTDLNNPPSWSALATRPERNTYPSAWNIVIRFFTAVTKAVLWRLSAYTKKLTTYRHTALT